MAKSGKVKEARLPEPLSLLVNQVVLLRAEAWEQGAVAIAALDSYLENLKFWSSVAQHHLFHKFPFLFVKPLC